MLLKHQRLPALVLFAAATLFADFNVCGQAGDVGPVLLATTTTTGAARSAPLTMPQGQDPFSNLIAGAASFDMDTPAEARAEFDPPVAPVGERVIYRITVSALDESLKIPDQFPVPAGLRLVPGGRGQVYQPSGNAQVRPQTTVLYRAIAATNGTFVIPAFDALAYGKPLKIPEAKLTVVSAGEIAGEGPPRLYLRLPTEDVYVGQSLRVPLVLPLPADGSVRGMSQPSISGEFIFSDQTAMGLRQENIRQGGKMFAAYVQEVMITPLHEGRLELIGSANSILLKPVPGQSNAFQSLSEFIDSDPVPLNVKPLPKEGQLPGFTGAIGTYQIDAPRLSTNELRAGEPLVLSFTLRGDANVGRLNPPPPPMARDWQAFPAIGESLSSLLVQQRGYAIFSYTLIPLSDRVKATPAIPFSCFDPKKKAYVNLTIPPLAVKVNPAPGGAVPRTESFASNVGGPETEDTSPRERELTLSGLAETPGGTAGSLRAWQQRGWFLALQLVPALGLCALWFWDRRRRHLEEHPEVILKQRARRGLRRQLRLARHAAAAGDAAGFVSGATGALREACAPHAAANPEALVCADVLQELPKPEQAGAAGESIRRLFAAADAVRFGGPVKNGPDLLALETDVVRVLNHFKEKL